MNVSAARSNCSGFNPRSLELDFGFTTDSTITVDALRNSTAIVILFVAHPASNQSYLITAHDVPISADITLALNDELYQVPPVELWDIQNDM